MRIITAFDDKFYHASGKRLLTSIEHFAPTAEVLVYSELEKEAISVPTVDLAALPEFQQVLSDYAAIIPTDMGGTASAEDFDGFNKRWFGWFRKVVSQYHAACVQPYDGYTLWLDTDVQIIKPLDDSTLIGALKAPVSVLKGDRKAIEAGVIFHDGRQTGTAEFARHFMNLFSSGDFRALERWDDGFVMTHCMNQHPHLVEDLASGLRAVKHTNKNGHRTSGQVLPLTSWGDYFEHDKGLHWRQGIVPDASSKTSEKSLLSRLNRKIRGR